MGELTFDLHKELLGLTLQIYLILTMEDNSKITGAHPVRLHIVLTERRR
jgi:hypothetical protein